MLNQKCNLCLIGRRGSDSSIETKSGTVLLGRVEASEEGLGVGGGSRVGGLGEGGRGGGLGEGGGAAEEATSQSLPLQVNNSSQNFAKLQR